MAPRGGSCVLSRWKWRVRGTGVEPRGDEGEAEIIPRLIDENEQLRTMVESLLEENARLVEHRDRLSARLTNLSRQLQAAHTAARRSRHPSRHGPRRQRTTKRTVKPRSWAWLSRSSRC
jgi:hypothetical protein